MRFSKRIAFVYALPSEGKKVYTGYHHGLGSLSAVLKKEFQTQNALFYLYRGCEKKLSEEIRCFSPDAVLITSCSGQIDLVHDFLKSSFIGLMKPFTIIGGPHATALPEETLQILNLNALCVGEGENPVLDFFGSFYKNEDYTSTRGMYFKSSKGQIKKNPLSVLVHPDDLPFSDRDLFDFQNFVKKLPREIGPEFLGSRGCSYDCSFCAAEKIHGKGMRFRSPLKIIEEIKEVIKRYSGAEIIGFHDNIFTLNKIWLREFCERYSAEINLPFWCNTRVDCITDDDIVWLKKSNCRRIHMGVESGSDRIRKEILKRPVNNQKIIDVFKKVKKNGIKTVSFNMIGLPTETEEDIRKTIDLNRAIVPSWIILSVFNPFPGTKLYDFCKENYGRIGSVSDDYYAAKTFLHQPSISAERVKYYHRHFVKMVYS